ncbi:hypothetical protein SLEP1_g36358 [Rubroshorea leprosula]|uniref:Uncharacterized protein n=1 Tax=Rubroshorea leprosula TaxID=152421 RepID=A0AAV5KRL9_9ROSI|nr:hypothetical protein SLEP1_g36358 [Rubroshorea leprosula]
MIHAATSDEDKLLQFSLVSIVNEVSEYILKRLEHKSPVVKEKALRLIKYIVVRPGMEFRRERQQNSVEVCQLLHYQGQLDLGGGIQGYKTRKQLMGNLHQVIQRPKLMKRGCWRPL